MWYLRGGVGLRAPAKAAPRCGAALGRARGGERLRCVIARSCLIYVRLAMFIMCMSTFCFYFAVVVTLQCGNYFAVRPRWRERERAGPIERLRSGELAGPIERERAGIAHGSARAGNAHGSAQARDFSAWMARDTEIHSYYVRRELARKSRRHDSPTIPTSQNSESDAPKKRETTYLRRRLPQQSKAHRNKKPTGTSLQKSQN